MCSEPKSTTRNYTRAGEKEKERNSPSDDEARCYDLAVWCGWFVEGFDFSGLTPVLYTSANLEVIIIMIIIMMIFSASILNEPEKP